MTQHEQSPGLVPRLLRRWRGRQPGRTAAPGRPEERSGTDLQRQLEALELVSERLTESGRVLGKLEHGFLRDLKREIKTIEATSKQLTKSQRAREEAWLDAGRLDYPGADIYLRLSSDSSLRRLHACKKEPWTVSWIEEWLHPGETLYDIGANIGAYSLVAAKAFGGGAHVVAFEPGPATFAALCQNIVLNDAEDAITPLSVALSDETGLAIFNLRHLEAGRALHSLDDGQPPGESVTAYRQPVLAFALDDLVERFELPPPTHVKLDVDGAEERVLAGAEATLARPELRSVMVELHPPVRDAVERRLAAHGLAQRQEFAPEPKPGREPPVHRYGLFARGAP